MVGFLSAKHKLFKEFKEKFVIFERQYDFMLKVSRRDHVPIHIVAGTDRLCHIKDELNILIEKYRDRLTGNEQAEAVVAVVFLTNTIDIALDNAKKASL